jgi:hypothetical protein
MPLDSQTLENTRARADAKLRYARIHLDLLHERGGNGGADFDRAVEESILFHLLGAKEAFLLELNAYYGCGLATEAVSPGKLREVFTSRSVTCQELAELHQLESDPNSWLAQVKQMRDHCAHISGVPRAFHIGGQNDGKVFLRNPRTGIHVEVHAPVALSEWIESMGRLLERLRASAIATNAA